ncbi:MarR family winged helix-turn-helix transcriptional regulator [Paracoccaceae bacterium GXU_MW_L88]
MPTRSETALIALRRILRATETHARQIAAQTDLTASQMFLLSTIAEAAAQTPTALSQKMSITQATTTALLNKLAEKNLIERRKSESDRRQVLIYITDAGRALLESAPNPLQSQFEQGFSALDDWEQAMLIASLERVASLLNASDADDIAPVLTPGEVG